jgi:SAM-dependent methyltransferase
MDLLSGYRATWQKKPALRAVYTDFYKRLAARANSGATLEIGGGSGNLKSFLAGVVSSDVQVAPWLDLACDAQQLPFRAGSFQNIVMVDVLHHVQRPILFLREAARVLGPGGRVLMCEPAITPASNLFYRLAHDETVLMSADPLADGPIDRARDPFEANQAVPTLLATRYRDRLPAAAGLRLAETRWFALWAYPLSGGFREWSLLPERLAGPLLALDWAAARWLGRVAGFRMLLVLEKSAR